MRPSGADPDRFRPSGREPATPVGSRRRRLQPRGSSWRVAVGVGGGGIEGAEPLVVALCGFGIFRPDDYPSEDGDPRVGAELAAIVEARADLDVDRDPERSQELVGSQGLDETSARARNEATRVTDTPSNSLDRVGITSQTRQCGTHSVEPARPPSCVRKHDQLHADPQQQAPDTVVQPSVGGAQGSVAAPALAPEAEVGSHRS